MAASPLIEQLVELREERGLTQSSIASLMGATQPVVARLEGGGRDPRLSTIERYAAALGVELAIAQAAGVDRPSIGRLAARLRARLEASDEAATDTFREVVQFVDDASRLDGPSLSAALGPVPVSTGDRRWDALLAATAEWLAERTGIEAPRWTAIASRSLPAPGWFVTPDRRLHRLVRASTPASFARHGVYLDGASLESV